MTFPVGESDGWAQVAAGAAQTLLSFDFPILSEDEFLLIRSRDGADSQMVLGDDYTVAGVQAAGGFSATLEEGAAAGDVYTAVRRTIAARVDSRFSTSGDFTGEAINSALDRLMLLVQELQTGRTAALRAPDSDARQDMALPGKDARAGRDLTFDAATGAPAASLMTRLQLETAVGLFLAGMSPAAAGLRISLAASLAAGLTLLTASVSAAAVGGTVELDQEFTLTENTSLPSKVCGGPGVIETNGFDLDLDGGLSAPHHARVFDTSGGGDVTIAGVGDVHVGWFVDPAADDDTAAMDAAEACAYASGARLCLSKAKALNYDGNFTLRVDLKGNAAVLTQITGSIILGAASALIVVGAAGVSIEDLTLDCQFMSSGIAAVSHDDITLTNVTLTNCINAGLYGQTCDKLKVFKSKAIGVKYRATGSAGLQADGFYFAGCTNSGADGCHAEDCRRIGFVGEKYGTTLGDNMFFTNLTGKNFNNCDDSTTEYNAFVWPENCSNVTIENVRGDELAGNTGQTSGRVRGVVLGGGQTAAGRFVLRNIDLRGTNGNIPNAVILSLADVGATVDIAGVFVKKANIGINGATNAAKLNIKNVHLDTMTYSTNGHGGIVFDASGKVLDRVTIDTVTETNNAASHNDAGTINWYSGNTATSYELRDLRGAANAAASHVMHGGVHDVSVIDSIIAAGADTYQSFAALTVRFKDSAFTRRAGVTKQDIIRNMTSGGKVTWEDCDIVDPAGTWQMLLPGASVSHSWVRCGVDGVQFFVQTTGTFSDTIEGGVWINAPTLGNYLTNYTNPTSQIFKCLGVTFRGSNTPLQKYNYNPTASLLIGNYQEASVLHNFDGGVSVGAYV